MKTGIRTIALAFGLALALSPISFRTGLDTTKQRAD